MTTEEKAKRLLEMQEHPECYTEEEIRQLITDEECRQLYEQMVMAVDAVFAMPSSRRAKGGHFLLQLAAAFIGLLLLSSIAYAAIHLIRNKVGGDLQSPTQEVRILDSSQRQGEEQPADSIPQVRIFENVPLDEIVSEIALYYKKVADIQDPQAHELRFYFVWAREDGIAATIEKLNNFESVNIVLSQEKLILK